MGKMKELFIEQENKRIQREVEFTEFLQECTSNEHLGLLQERLVHLESQMNRIQMKMKKIK